MRIKDGDTVYAEKTISGTLGTVKAGDTFVVVRITSTHVIGKGIICKHSDVSLWPTLQVEDVVKQMKKEIGL